jgi:alkylation response protein AidB-like acyl-CoA dehydrogenase
MYAGRLPDAAYEELYPTRDRPTSGSFHPRGRAERVDGGFLVSGRWDWGSGSYTAHHVVGGCMVFDGDEPVMAANGKQMHLGIWLPKGAVVPADNWQTLGLRGSGSTSYSIEVPAFVPATHSFDREAAYNPDADPLNKTPKICHFALGGVVLGVARRAVRLAGEALRAKATAGGVSAVDPALRQALGEAMGEVDFAYGGMRAVARATDEIIFGGGELLPLHEARMTAANAVAAGVLRRVLPLCTELVGARYILDTHPMQKVLRDGYGALAHAGTGRSHLGAQAAVALADLAGGFTLPDDPLDQVARFGDVCDAAVWS